MNGRSKPGCYADNFVRLTIEIIKQLQKLTQGLVSLCSYLRINAERVFSLRSRNVAELGPARGRRARR